MRRTKTGLDGRAPKGHGPMAALGPAEPVVVGADGDGRRLDNWLFSRYKNVPKGRIYRAIRRGEVRVNGRRAKAADKLARAHEVRVPPLSQNRAPSRPPPLKRGAIEQLKKIILYEDEHLLVVDKPAGWPVHAGHHRQCGLGEALSRWRSTKDECLAPAHRLDRETSGCLIFARDKPAMLALHENFRRREVRKTYLALLTGHWDQSLARVECPLSVSGQPGLKKVVVDNSGAGKPSLSLFKPVRQFASCVLARVETKSGRMHQIRAHAAHCRRPLVGERRYGDAEQRSMNARLRAPRLCLHASRVSFALRGRDYCFIALLPEDFAGVLRRAML